MGRQLFIALLVLAAVIGVYSDSSEQAPNEVLSRAVRSDHRYSYPLQRSESSPPIAHASSTAEHARQNSFSRSQSLREPPASRHGQNPPSVDRSYKKEDIQKVNEKRIWDDLQQSARRLSTPSTSSLQHTLKEAQQKQAHYNPYNTGHGSYRDDRSGRRY